MKSEKIKSVPELRFPGFAGEWEAKSLGKVTRFKRGFDLPSSNRQAGQYPIISSSGCTGYHNEFKVVGPGIVTGRYGSIGEVFLVNESHWPLNTSLWVEDFFGNDITFSYFMLQNVRFESLSDKTGVPGINRNDLHQLDVLIPPLPEQQKIAEFLTAVDGRIAQLSRKKALLEDYKKGVMQQLFTQTLRFKDDDGNEFPEWEERTLGEVAEVKTGPFGSTLHRSDYVEVGTPIITVEHLSDYGLVHKNLPLVSDSDRERLKSYSLRENDIVFSRVGSVDRNSVVKKEEDGWLFSGRILRIRPDYRLLDARFLGYYFQLEVTKYRIRSVAVGQTMASLNTEILKAFQVVTANLGEQTKIANFLTALDRKIESVTAQITHTQTWKKGLLQQMFV